MSMGVNANQVDIGASLNVEEYDWGMKDIAVTQNIVPTAGENTTIEVNLTIYHDLGVDEYIFSHLLRMGVSADIDNMIANPNDPLTTDEFLYADNLSNCAETVINSTETSYVCEIDLPYWATAGEYKVWLEVENSLPNTKTYTETTMVQELSSIEASSLNFHWTSVNAGEDNVLSDANITLANIGNVDFVSSTMTGSNMEHATAPDVISADSFFVNSVNLDTTAVNLGMSVLRDYATNQIPNLRGSVSQLSFTTAPEEISATVNVPYVIGGVYTSVTDWVLSLATA